MKREVELCGHRSALTSRPPGAGRRPASNGLPVGTQTAVPLCTTTGTPPASTRVAPTTHCAVTHGPPDTGGNGQPATTYGVLSVVDRLAADQHARERDGRRRLAAVGAENGRAEVDDRAWHQTVTAIM